MASLVLRLFFQVLMGEVPVLDELCKRGHLHRFAVIHAEVALGDGQAPVPICNLNFGAAANVLRGSWTHLVSVIARSRAHASSSGLPITEEKRDRVVRMAGLRPVRSLYFSALKINFKDSLGVGLVVILVVDLAELPVSGHTWADHGHVVPGGAAEGFGCLLQPGVIDKAAVVNRGIRTERYFNRVRIGLRCRRQSAQLSSDRSRRSSAAGDKTIMQRAAPPGFKIHRRVL